jgi:predicted transcriptional regulator
MLTVPLGFTSSNDFSGLVVAATRAYPVGELARSALRACTRVQGVQTVVCAPFVAAGL